MLTTTANKIYNKYKQKNQLKNWTQDKQYKSLPLVDRFAVFNLINSFIKKDFGI